MIDVYGLALLFFMNQGPILATLVACLVLFVLIILFAK